MKRLVSMLTAVCLLCAAFASALAADGNTLRVVGGLVGYYTQEQFNALYPDLPVEGIPIEYSSEEENNARELLLSGNWDVARIEVGSQWTTDLTLQELYHLGLVMDLGDDAALAEKAEAMFPAVKDAVTVDGHLVGIPSYIFRKVMQLSLYTPQGDAESPFQNLGFTQADIPQTFTGLCDLAVAYAALPKSERKGTAFDIDCISMSSYRYFLNYLIELYSAEFCDEAGNVEYDTPAFRSALADLQRMSDALDTGKAFTYGKDGSAWGMVRDAGSELAGCSGDYRDLNLYLENSESIPAWMGVLIVNPNTANPEKALQLVSTLLDTGTSQFTPMLYDGLEYATLARQAYEDDLAFMEMFEDDEELESYISQYADDPEACYMYTRAQLEDYRQNVAPYLTFHPVPGVNTDTAVRTYLKSNKLDVEGLIRYLNDSVQAARE